MNDVAPHHWTMSLCMWKCGIDIWVLGTSGSLLLASWRRSCDSDVSAAAAGAADSPPSTAARATSAMTCLSHMAAGHRRSTCTSSGRKDHSSRSRQRAVCCQLIKLPCLDHVIDCCCLYAPAPRRMSWEQRYTAYSQPCRAITHASGGGHRERARACSTTTSSSI
jgi:hypothetical protein